MAQEIYHRSEWGNPNEQWGNVYLNADLTNELYKRASEYENSWVTDQLLNGVGTKPSIILTPTAYEDGLLNSVKPKGGENLLTYSEDFSQSNWQKYQISLNSNNTISPDGTQNASEITINSSTPSLGDTSLSLTVGDTYTLSCFVKKGTNRWVRLASVSSGSLGAWFDLENNVVGTVNSTSASIENYGNGWYRISNTITAISGSNQAFLGLSDADGGTSSTQVGNNVYVWGFQVERGRKATTYISTNGTAYKNADFDFTRGSSSTRVNEKGLVQDVQLLSGELVQNGDFEQIGSENIVNGSFDTDTDWTKGTGWSISGGKAISDGTSGSHNLTQGGAVTAGKTYKITITVSDYVSGNVEVSAGAAPRGTMTANGTYTFYQYATPANSFYIIANSFEGSIDNVSVKEVGQNWSLEGGWSVEDGKAIYTGTTNSDLAQSGILTSGKLYKLQYEVINSTLVNGIVKLSGTTASAQNVLSQTVGTHTLHFTADGTSPTSFNIRIVSNTSGQFEIDNISVVEVTDDTDLPRINYTDGEGSLLLEPQSTNKVTYSEDFTQWTKAGGASVESGYLAPDGSNNAYKVSGTSSSSLYLASITNTTDTRTIWARTVSGTGDVYLCGNLNDANALFTVTSQWQRFELNGFTGGGATTFYAVDFRGSSTLTEVIIWGAQAEALSYATSYIPTNGSTVTRLADVCNNSGSSDLINSTEGVLYAEISALANDGTNRAISISDNTTSNVVRFYYSVTDNRIVGNVKSGGTNVFNYNNVLTDATDFLKIAISYKANDFKMYVNGTEVSTDTSGSVPTSLSELAFDNGAGADNFYGNVKCLAVFKEALSDTELQKLTTI